MSDVAFSAPEVAVIAGLLATLCTPLATLFWLLQKAKESLIERLQTALDRSEAQAEQMIPALREQVHTMHAAQATILKEQERQGRILEDVLAELRQARSAGGRGR